MGLSSIIEKKAFDISKLQSGYLYYYTFLMLLGLTILLDMRQFWLLIYNNFDFKILYLLYWIIILRRAYKKKEIFFALNWLAWSQFNEGKNI